MNNRVKRSLAVLAACFMGAAALPVASASIEPLPDPAQERIAQSNRVVNLTLLQTGDIHGHLIPRPCLRCEDRQMVGGLAYLYSKIEEVRAARRNTLLFNTGDTIQGGAEALYTRGQAVVNILDQFGYDGFAPGNWDFVYGAERFLELFGDGRWGAVAANVTYDPAVYPDKGGQLVLPPYRILNVAGLKIGVLGLSTERIVVAPGPFATKGFLATSEGAELPGYIDILRNQEKVDLVFLVSEFGLAKNVYFGENYPGIDVILSSDMHEETREPVVTRNGTIVSEAGQDGTRLGQLDLKIRRGKIVKWDYELHLIDTRRIKPNARIAAMVKNERKEFVASPFFKTHVNPFNGMVLKTPIDTVVGVAAVDLHRNNFTDMQNMSALVAGTSHNFLADAFRSEADADIGHIRGFRYGTNVAPGRIKLEDLYHFIPIGPQIAKTTITGKMLKDDLEANIDGSINPDIFKWTGGWQQALSGVRYDLDVYAARGSRILNVQVFNRLTRTWEPLDATKSYTYAGYWYAQNAGRVGALPASGTVTPLKGPNGETLDGTEVVVNYLKTRTANPDINRVNLLYPLPPPVYGNPEQQPLKGIPIAH